MQSYQEEDPANSRSGLAEKLEEKYTGHTYYSNLFFGCEKFSPRKRGKIFNSNLVL